jgi:hypothetical protein
VAGRVRGFDGGVGSTAHGPFAEALSKKEYVCYRKKLWRTGCGHRAAACNEKGPNAVELVLDGKALRCMPAEE